MVVINTPDKAAPLFLFPKTSFPLFQTPWFIFYFEESSAKAMPNRKSVLSQLFSDCFSQFSPLIRPILFCFSYQLGALPFYVAYAFDTMIFCRCILTFFLILRNFASYSDILPQTLTFWSYTPKFWSKQNIGVSFLSTQQ